MKIKNIKQTFFYVFAVGASIFLLFFIISCVWIGYEVKNQCREAKREYLPVGRPAVEMDCVEALISVLNNENKDFRVRNSAIWALGQLGDSRALPTLQSYYTGNIPPREPLDKSISQYELKKAINLTSGGLNITAIFWRNNQLSGKISEKEAQSVKQDTTIKATFNCDAEKTIIAEFKSEKVELVLSDERKIELPQAISASGARFANSDESFVFWNKGDTAFIEENGQTTFADCLEAVEN